MDENREHKVIEALKNNWILVSILAFATVVRLYYLKLTWNQPLWFDESEYFSTMVHWAFDVPYELGIQRPPLFQYIGSLFFKIGLGEMTIKVLLVVVPSIILVYVVYLLGKEMFNKKIGLVAAFINSIFWTFLFWSNRGQPDYLSMVFQVLAILFMWKYWKGAGNKFAFYSGLLSVAGFYFKVSALLIPMIFIVYIFFLDGFSAIKKKGYWLYALGFLLGYIPYAIWAFYEFSNVLAFKYGYVDAMYEFPIGWYNIKFYYILTKGILFGLFCIGSAAALRFLLYLDVLYKEKSKRLDGLIFSVISLVFISCFYIFYMRNTDDRWVFLWMPFISFIISSFLIMIHNYLKPNLKVVANVLLIGVLLFAAYQQISYTDELISIKKDSYQDVKDAGLWLKQSAPSSAKVLSISYPQTVYYSQRNVTTYSRIYNVTSFEEYIIGNNPDYLILSIYEPHPQFIYEWAQNATNEGRVIPVKGYGEQSPRLIIYKFNY